MILPMTDVRLILGASREPRKLDYIVYGEELVARVKDVLRDPDSGELLALLVDESPVYKRVRHAVVKNQRKARIAALEAKNPMKTCLWIPSPDGGFFDSYCGEAFHFADGIEKDARYRYCPGCGKLIVEEAYS